MSRMKKYLAEVGESQKQDHSRLNEVWKALNMGDHLEPGEYWYLGRRTTSAVISSIKKRLASLEEKVPSPATIAEQDRKIAALESQLKALTARLDADFPAYDVTSADDPVPVDPDKPGNFFTVNISSLIWDTGKRKVRTRYGRRELAEFNNSADAHKYAEKLTKKAAK